MLLILSAEPIVSGQGVRQSAPSLTIQGLVTLTVGMSESAARAVLKRSNYDLADQGDGFFIVFTKVGEQSVGSGDSLYFRNGRLVMATARWPQKGRADVNLADTLYGALTSLGNSNSCQVTPKPVQNPGLDMKSIMIECPPLRRRVSVVITRGPNIGVFVSVEETIF
jgi:hypothetical protein